MRGGVTQAADAIVEAAAAAIPPCPGAEELSSLIRVTTRQFFPRQLSRVAA